jgi:alpha/beta hydrolase family protein
VPVTGFEVVLRRPLADGMPFGDVGAYEELKGRLVFSIDPAHGANARITDVERAPRDARGRVGFAADVSILLPVQRARANGRVILDVVNRGNTVTVPNFNRATRPVFAADSAPHPPIDVGDGFLMRRGYTVVSCGWQGDVPRIPGLLRLEGPGALDDGGRPLRGRVYTRLQANDDVAHFLLSDRGHVPGPAADLEEPGAVLTVRDEADAEPRVIPREQWRFARSADGRIVPDATWIWMQGGFARGRLYEIVYTTIGAPVRGLGMAALRDTASWLKHGAAAHGNPLAGIVRWALAYGRSQTGRLLRTYLYEDLNLDEDGREAIDGILANVAGGMRGEFNQRFGQNSKDRPHVMPHLFPFTDTEQEDPVTGARGALHASIDARGSAVKVFYTNTSAEYHRGDASLIHTSVDGKADHRHGDRTRVYHFAGTEHGLGVWPPADCVPAPADPTGGVERAQNLRGIVDYSPLLRACLVNLDRWVTEGVAPPPSRHPRVDDSTAVAPHELAAAFARVPGARFPHRHALPQRLDFSTLPPRRGPAYGSRVSAVDADGNELAGIALPEVAVPVATHTGWTLRHAEIGGDNQLLVFAGATIPFAATRRAREAAGDPRASLEERYASRAAYLAAVRRAGEALARQRYMLEDDIEVSVQAAARSYDWVAGLTRSPEQRGAQ